VRRVLAVTALLLAVVGCSSGSGSATSCQPTCRSGYVCVSGACRSACNPACTVGQECVISSGVATCATAGGADGGGDASQLDGAGEADGLDATTPDGGGDAFEDLADAPADFAPDSQSADGGADAASDRPWPGTGTTRGKWTNLTPSNIPQTTDGGADGPAWPSAREFHGLTYDEDRGQLVMFGGFDRASPNTQDPRTDELWEWDSVKTTWVNRTPKVRPVGWPSVRADHGLVYDSSRRRTVLFGGSDGSTIYGDTWEWDGQVGTWELRSASDADLGGWNAFGMAFDPDRKKAILFGGARNGTPASNQIWEWAGDSAMWSSRTPATLPVEWPDQRLRPNFVFDTARSVAVLFGGWQGSGTPAADTWEWNGTTGVWRSRPAGAMNPPAAQETLAAYDSGRARTVLFLNTPTMFVWEWDGDTWRDVTPVAGPAPDFNSRQKAAYDPVTQRVLVFGGEGEPTNRQLWAWQGP
jgi:hypothetical protein